MKENNKQRNTRIIVSILILLLIPAALLLSRLGSSGAVGNVMISEILASNSAYPDQTGQYRDFVELYNDSSRSIDLSGCGLTDSSSVKYRFPSETTLGPGEYFLIWCDSAGSEKAGIAPFSISRDGGETVALLSSRGHVIDSAEVLPCRRNQSMISDGNGGWTLSDTPTPGYPNTEEGYAAYLASRSAEEWTLHISEFMSSNSLYPAPDGQYYDWIELRNSGSEAVDLGGWSLSDSPDEPKHVFASGETVPAGGYYVVWCGGGGAGFSLSHDGGETLCLLSPDGELADRIDTPAMEKDTSYALISGIWEPTAPATPGFENSENGFEAYLETMGWGDCPVILSEAMAENRGCILDSSGAFSDWIELHNDSAAPVDLSGFWLSDDPEKPAKWQFPSLSIAPESYVLVWCDERNTVLEGECHTSFSLSRYGETLTLSTPVGSPVSTLQYAAIDADRSALNTGSEALVTDAPSPGFENTPEGALAFLSSRATPAPLAINEVMSSNGHLLRQSDGKYYDWAEFRNTGDAAISLSDYTLSDDPAQPERFRFPETVLAPGETFVVILSGGASLNNSVCTDFSLNGTEDWLYLFGPDGTVLDYLRVANLPYQGSIGRLDGQSGFFYFSTPTPGAQNSYGERGVTAAPTADLAPGIYDSVEKLTVALSGPGEIRYTTNGNIPTEASELYTGPLTLTKTTALRARCFAAGSLPGETATLNYIINEEHTLPVVCFDLAPNDFTYIYNGGMRGDEVHANVSFYDPDGGSFSKDCGLMLHGASSRHLFLKRSMKAVFRARYGGELDYDVFGDGEITTFDSITLRGGTMENSYALIRDAVCTDVAEALSDNVLYLKIRYCTLYVNGAYWGIYAIREAYSEKYCADHLDVRDEDIRISRAPVAYTANTDLADKIFDLDHRGAREPERYDEVAEWLDMDSLADWMILQAYFTNTDVPGNVRYIYSAGDGKWRYALFDLDNSMMSSDPSWDFVFDYSNECGIIPRKMVQNPIFLDKLLTRMAEWLSGPLNEPYVRSVMDAYYDELAPEWDREAARWGGYAFFESSHRALTNYLADGRGEKLIRNLARDIRLSQEDIDRYFGDILS